MGGRILVFARILEMAKMWNVSKYVTTPSEVLYLILWSRLYIAVAVLKGMFTIAIFMDGVVGVAAFRFKLS